MAVYPPQRFDFSKTQRLVFLIDLHPFLTVHEPASYISAVISAASRLLRFSPLSSSLFAHKFFFSSLSPLRSADLLPRHICSSSLSFNFPPETLASLSSDLNSINSLCGAQDSPIRPLASHTAMTLHQLIHDFAWEDDNRNLLGEDNSTCDGLSSIPSNLVILFSPINFLLESINLRNSDGLTENFECIFSAVREAFVIRDMHLCWVDVNNDELRLEKFCERRVDDVYGARRLNFENCIRNMGWGFCSAHLIIFGSTLLPLGLIYPIIGLKFDFRNLGDIAEIKCGQLNLEILDVHGMPLECNLCDLEFVKLKNSPNTIRNQENFSCLEADDKYSFFGQFCSGRIKLHVRSVHGYDECRKALGFKEFIVVRQSFEETRKSRKKSAGDFFADRVLETLHGKMGGLSFHGQVPTWQILLSFFYEKCCWAMVSVVSSNGHACMASLKPFTAHMGILSIMDSGNLRSEGVNGSIITKINQDDNVGSEDMLNRNGCFSFQTDSSTSGNYEQDGNGKRKKKQRHLYEKMTWSSFCKTAFDGSLLDLLEIYIAAGFENSKKLKFLKCWMKQIGKIVPFSLTLHQSNAAQETTVSHAHSLVLSKTEEQDPPGSHPETLETFFDNILKRIRNGLESGVNLQNLASQVVKSFIHRLHMNCEIKNSTIALSSIQNSSVPSSDPLEIKLIKLVLRDPKEMKKVHQGKESSFEASEPSSSSKNIFREYELQIFLRLEIMRSDVSVMISDSSRRKLTREICSLLDIIQYLVAGGIHGHISLYDYVERTIKARYSEELEGVVKKIYKKMDLLPFGDEEEIPSLLFNSEDSNLSWRGQYGRNDKAESNSNNQSISAEDEYFHPLSNADVSQQDTGKDNHAHMLSKARERREKARRVASFTSRVPDLQRVWAIKQPKTVKSEFDFLPKNLNRKGSHKSAFSVVYETPMGGIDLAFSKENKEQENLGNSSYSVSKALFQDI